MRAHFFLLRPGRLGAHRRSHYRSQLPRGEALCARGHSRGIGDERQAAISLDAEAIHRAVSAVAHIKKAAVVAQSHVYGDASCACRSRYSIEQRETAVFGNRVAGNGVGTCVCRVCEARVLRHDHPAGSLLCVSQRRGDQFEVSTPLHFIRGKGGCSPRAARRVRNDRDVVVAEGKTERRRPIGSKGRPAEQPHPQS